MEKEIISTASAPKAVGPYSQAVKANGFLYISGQLPIVPETGEFVSNDVVEQAEQCLKNVGAILAEAGMTYDNVVKATVFLTDIADFAKVNEVYAKYFKAPYPARSAFSITALPKGGLVEVEVVATE